MHRKNVHSFETGSSADLRRPTRRSVAYCISLTVACASIVAPLAAAEAKTSAAMQAAALPRVIAVEGGSNFRDIGGYRTKDGRTVRFGLVYRSASTDNLTAADFRKIDSLGIRKFYDLRDAAERHPRRPAGVSVPPIQTWPDRITEPLDLSSAAAVELATEKGYAEMPKLYAPQIGQIFRQIARCDTPILYNCAGGKDRTGLTTALLLSLLDVPREMVIADYLASNRLLDPSKVAGDPAMGGIPPGMKLDPAVIAALSRSKASWLQTSFAAIERSYGSLNAYWRLGLKLTPQEIASIRTRMLTKR